MIRSGHEAARGVAEDVLRLEAANLQLGRHRGAELDDVVVEERHAHLERVRHRGAVEVVEHVVREARAARRGRAPPAAARPGRSPSRYEIARSAALPSSSASGPRTSCCRSPGVSAPLIASSRSAGSGRRKSLDRAAQASRDRARRRRAARAAAARAPAARRRRSRPRGASGSRRGARRRPGPRARRSRAARRAPRAR